MLDQASSTAKKLELDDVQNLLGIPPSESLTTLMDIITGSDTSATLMSNINNLYDHGFQAAAIAKQLAQIIRNQIMNNELVLPAEQVFSLLDQLIEVPIAHNPERYLEICLLRVHNLNNPEPSPVIAKPAHKVTKTDEPAVAQEVKPPKQKPEPEVKAQNEAIEKAEPEVIIEEVVEVQKEHDIDDTLWPKVLLALKQKHNTVYGVVRMAEPSFTDDRLRLAFKFAFHQKRIGEAANRKLLTDIITELTGKPLNIECVYDKSAVAPHITVKNVPPTDSKEVMADISAISNIFGGGELLES